MNRSFLKNKNNSEDPSLNRENIDLESFLKDKTMIDIVEHENIKRNRLMEVASKCRSTVEQLNHDRIHKFNFKNNNCKVENEYIKDDDKFIFEKNVMDLNLEDFVQKIKYDNHNKSKEVTNQLLEEYEDELKLKVNCILKSS